jgi:hypothetical protein
MKKSTKSWAIIIIILIILAIIIGAYVYFSSASSDCAKAGELSLNDVTGESKECCSGLQEVGNLPDGTPEECAEYANMEGYGSICTACGNGNCEQWENKCICPADCK